MLKIIPPLYPDEHIYSWISRYHTYSGNLTLQETKFDLFNINKRQMEYSQLIKNIDDLCEKFPQSLVYKYAYNAMLNK